MADLINCPVCGTENPSDQEYCRSCQAALAATDEGDASSIQPGQSPTKRQTAELEPILPQWLRDARDAARSTEPEDSNQAMPPQSEKTRPIASEDLLAGLQSQSGQDEDEDVPDWLANITGAQPKPKVEQQPETTGARWVEMGARDDFPSEDAAEEADMPDWLAGLQATQAQPEKDELTDIYNLTRSVNESLPTQPPAQELPPEAAPHDFASSETPEWLRQMALDADERSATAEAGEQSAELPLDAPDWLSGLGGPGSESTFGESSAGVSEPAPAESEALDLPPSDMPDWLRGSAESEKPAQDTTPKWLREESGGASEPETPAWLASEDTVYLPSEPQQETPEQDALLVDLPDWLKAAAPNSSIFEQPAEQPTSLQETPEPSFDSPDWIKSLGATEASEDVPAADEEKSSPFENAPAFTPDLEGDENLSSLFTEMPDWLSNAIEPTETPSSSTSSAPTPITSDDALAPSDLPSWVQAMRPVETGIVQPSLSSDRTLESRGALAGLQGVLPAVPGFAPTSKPKAISIKLNTNEEQLKHAGILEQILAAETSPVPMESYAALRTSRGLRWALGFLMVVMIAVVLGLRMENFSTPLLAPNETRAAMSLVDALPPNAALLVAVDYEASRAGEMEVAAAPMFDQLMLVKQPRLTFVSTNEVGSMLAERIITGPLAEHNVSYVNLGYLSGGQMGIRAFVKDPVAAAPLSTSLQPAWGSTALTGISQFEQFSAVILITDNAEAARSWIEQTEDVRGSMPFIVISSAQATPMVMPYYDSGQVTGVVSGLYGGAIFEQYIGQPGSARTYWDAYSIGMLFALILVLGGGFWNLVLGWRERAAARGAE